MMRGSMAGSITPSCRSTATRMTLPCSRNWVRRGSELKKPVSDVTASAAGAASVGGQSPAPAPALFSGERHERLENRRATVASRTGMK